MELKNQVKKDLIRQTKSLNILFYLYNIWTQYIIFRDLYFNLSKLNDFCNRHFFFYIRKFK